MKKCSRSFFNQPTVQVAQELLGQVLAFQDHRGIITETEAYCGFDDPASHAARGETPRTKIMFGKPGYAYVYLIYGMYHCLNFVTEKPGYPAAVLIRGIQLLNGSKKHLDGPGKLCRELGITKEHNGSDIVNGCDFQVLETQDKPSFIQTPRIGIKVGLDKFWRFKVS